MKKTIHRLLGLAVFTSFIIAVSAPASAKTTSYRYVKVSERELMADFDKDGNYEPYFIRGVGYSPYPISRHPSDWGWPDTNDPRKDNFLADATILERDFALLEKMNANTIRIWKGDNTKLNGQYPVRMTKRTLNRADKYGLKVIAGFFVNPSGSYQCAEGKSEYVVYEDLTDSSVRQDYIDRFGEYVSKFKDHPAILFWAIGNENNLYLNSGDEAQIKAWYSLADEMAKKAKDIEGEHAHPVAVVNGDLGYIGDAGIATDDKLSNIDIWGVNAYRGESLQEMIDEYSSKTYKPLWIAEFGLDAWFTTNPENPEEGYEDQETQAQWVGNLWEDIAENDHLTIGGTVMSYSDEWWKPWEWMCGDDSDNCNSTQGYAGESAQVVDCSTGENATGREVPAPDKFFNAEWWGIMSIAKDPLKYGYDQMKPRSAYYTLQQKFSSLNRTYKSNTKTQHVASSENNDEVAEITIPAPGSTLESSSITFEWDAVTGATAYWLHVGTSTGAKDYYNSGETTDTQITVTGLPQDGSTVYARLWTRIASEWQYNDYSYTTKEETEKPTKSTEITSPENGSTLTGSEVKFKWNAGTGVTTFWLYAGKSEGTKEYYSSGKTTETQTTATGLPQDGSTVYVRLWYKVDSKWQFKDYTYATTKKAETPTQSPEITSPENGSTLTGSKVDFKWSTGKNVTAYWLYAGKSEGTKEYYNSGKTTETKTTVTGLPQDGSTVYVQLWYKIDSKWQSNFYTYTAQKKTETPTESPKITSPENGSTLTGSKVDFKWSAGTDVTAYWLYAGKSEGTKEYYNSGKTTKTKTTVTGLPQDGSTVYVQLWYKVDSKWQSNFYTYTAQKKTEPPAAEPPEITSPENGSTLTDSTVDFTWSAGTDVTAYWLYAGKSKESKEYYNSGKTTDTKTTVTGLPQDGSTVYVRLWYKSASGWQYNDYTYTTKKKADSSGPTGSIVLNDGDTYTDTSSVKALLSATDDKGVTAYYLSTSSSSTPSATASGWRDISVSPSPSWSEERTVALSSADGTRTLYVWYKDADENVSGTYSDSIIVDSTAPTVNITSPTTGSTYTSSDNSIDVGVSVSDATSGISKVTWTNSATGIEGSVTGNNTVFTLDNISLESGVDNVITVYAHDKAGNTGQKTLTVTYNSATSGPTGSIILNDGQTYTNTSSVKALLSATDDKGVTAYYLSTSSSSTPSATASGWRNISGSPSTSWSEERTVALSSADGTRTLYVWYKDADENVSNTYSDSIIVDSTAPTINITSPTTGAVYISPSSSINVGVSVSDATSGISRISWVNSATGIKGSLTGDYTTFTLSNITLESGADNVITVYAYDKVGNTGQDTFIVKYTTPQHTLKVINLQGGVPSNGTITSADGKINCGTTAGVCTADYAENSSVVLSASPAKGYTLDHWGSACNGTSASSSCTITMSSDKTAIASFKAK
jgi:hypothetical protein